MLQQEKRIIHENFIKKAHLNPCRKPNDMVYYKKHPERKAENCMNTQNMPQENNTPNQFEEESRQAREATKKLKRTIMIVLCGMVIFGVLGTMALGLLENLESEQGGKDEVVTMGRPSSIDFYPYIDYDYDIMQDDEYLSLDRSIYYTDKRMGETFSIEDKDIFQNDYGPAVQTLKKMIDAITAGDADAYNALFSENYFAVEGNNPEEPFTMQQVYDIKFTRMAVTEKNDTQYGRYTQYEFEVEYKIHKNNGTFRTDIGMDDARRQYFVLSDSTSNDVLIDQILNYNYVN